jgi:hypothetical protein
MPIVKWSTITSGLPPSGSRSISQMIFRLTPHGWVLQMSEWAATTDPRIRKNAARRALQPSFADTSSGRPSTLPVR